MNENSVVAIDFGTSRTKLAYFDPKTKDIELMDHGIEKFLPSYFAVDEKGKILLGYEAQERLESGDRRAVSNIKGQISELSIKPTFFQRVGKTPQELLTALFTYLREEAGKLSAFETTPQRACLTHPTTFSEADKEILKNAAQDAGFSVELIEEPVAAAEFVRMSRRDLPTDLIILDCGAGTLHWTYMVREYIYGDEPKHIIKPNIKPGGTMAGETKASVGGSYIERSLALMLKERIGRIESDDFELLYHELKVRKEQFCRNSNPDDEIPPIKIRDYSVPVNGREMKAAIETHYITPACKTVAPYIKKVIDVTEAEEGNRKPALLLTGGCAQIKDFKVALEEQFGLDCIVIPEYEYATVRGAIPLPEGIRSEPQTQQSERIETAKEKFDRFGNEIGDTLVNDAMSLLIELAIDESTRFKGLNIKGDPHIYLWTRPFKNAIIGLDNAGEVKSNIIRYFVEHTFQGLDEKIIESFRLEVNDFIKRLDGEALSRAQVLRICEVCIKEVVSSILDEILTTKIDIKKEIKKVVKRDQGIFVKEIWKRDLTEQARMLNYRRREARYAICRELRRQLQKSRNTQEAQIRDAVVKVFRSTAEELCQQLIDAPDHIKSSSTS